MTKRRTIALKMITKGVIVMANDPFQMNRGLTSTFDFLQNWLSIPINTYWRICRVTQSSFYGMRKWKSDTFVLKRKSLNYFRSFQQCSMNMYLFSWKQSANYWRRMEKNSPKSRSQIYAINWAIPIVDNHANYTTVQQIHRKLIESSIQK